MTLMCSLAVAALFPMAGTIPRSEPVQAMTEFLARVADYVEIRREVTAGVDGPVFCSDPEEMSRQAAQHAAAIRHARPLGEGTIFTPRVALFFRERTAHAVRIGALELAIEDGQPDDVVPEVNAALPWGDGEPAPTRLVGLLPLLPDGLEYRLVGRHLVLLDVEVNLVVDVLWKAVPGLLQTPANRPAGGCGVHPDLPACWM